MIFLSDAALGRIEILCQSILTPDGKEFIHAKLFLPPRSEEKKKSAQVRGREREREGKKEREKESKKESFKLERVFESP